jgi:hypoxanthine phosphoribosyltransferase
MQQDIRQILIGRQAIDARVREMARQIAADYGEQEIVLVPLLTGSIVFVADLIRHLPLRMRIDVLAVSSYRGKTHEGTRVLYPATFGVRGKHVLVIDDILDSGRTLATVSELLIAEGAAAIKTCVLLRKKLEHVPAKMADYVGFEIPDEFVVGYGLDFDGYYRNLPDIAILHERVFKE